MIRGYNLNNFFQVLYKRMSYKSLGLFIFFVLLLFILFGGGGLQTSESPDETGATPFPFQNDGAYTQYAPIWLFYIAVFILVIFTVSRLF